jgi:hypothetical protein
MTIITKLGGRKFIISLIIEFCATALAVVKIIDGVAWQTITMAVLMAYGIANVAGKNSGGLSDGGNEQ